MNSLLAVSPQLVRRLNLTRQRLAGPLPAPGRESLLEVARDLGCIQLDPISAVDRSHRLVWFSRAGQYTTADLDQVLWKDRQLFEYWAHCASLVLTEDYPIHQRLMRTFGRSRTYYGTTRTVSPAGEWMQQNEPLRRYILRELKRHGPLPSRALEEDGLETKAWVTSGWTSGRNVSRMLDYLLMQGKIMVAGRAGGQKLWDLAERVLPAWTPRERLSEPAVVRRAAERSLRALGAGTLKHINEHFIRLQYPGLKTALAQLEKQGHISRVQVADMRGEWYVHSLDLPLLDDLQNGAWQPRTVLLSPFDNLICNRQRTRDLFNFDFLIEIYVPKAKRKFGYYVLPILHGDRLIGRVDPTMDRAAGRLKINAVFAEPDAPTTRVAAKAVAGAIRDLAGFLGATAIEY
ncbi:MAG: crosslink repair DNA glycosylase YcaQ family protein, partial [Anaerolineales bacterium]